jgi:sugar phosphate isomerase/epimerase
MKIPLIAIALTLLCSCSSRKVQTDSSSTSTSQPAVAADWNIGLQLYTFRLFTFHDAIAKADSCGIKRVQAYSGQDLGGSWTGKFGPEMDAAQRQAVKDYVASKGITIDSYGVVGAEDLEGWINLFAFAKDMGIPLIVSEPKTEQWNFIDSLAGVNNMRVAIHDHPRPNRYWHPDSVVAAMQGRPNIGACADVGHWARSGLKPEDCLKILNGRIWNVHFKDVVTFDKTDARDTMPGQGVINFPAVFQELKRQNYKGTFSIEHESNWENNAGDVIEIVKFYHDQVKGL